MPDPAARQVLVDRARETWIRKLIDLSRRNNLLYYRELRTGTLDLTDADPEATATLIAGAKGNGMGEVVPLARLVREPIAATPASADEVGPAMRTENDAGGRAAAQLAEIRRRALANLEEKGLDTLFLALGMATWAPDDEGRPPQAPVVLMPLAIESRGRDVRTLGLRRVGDLQINLVLLHVLGVRYGIDLEADALAELIQGDDEGEAFDLTPLVDRLHAKAKDVPGFTITRSLVVSNFSFQKLAMVRDLRTLGPAMVAHDLIAGIAGDVHARAAARGTRLEVDPQDFDRTAPEDEFLIMDADSSQQRVIAAVGSGQSGVISGPPGTGKSQTISNLVAALASAGRRVLFVAEKRAALDVVKRRLDDRGLGHLCLDLHGADISRRQIMRQLADSLEIVREAPAVDADDLHRRLVDRRARLNAHVARVHTPAPPSDLTVFQLQGRVLQVALETRAETRWRGADLDRLTSAAIEASVDLLVEAAGFERLFLRDDPSAWTGARIPDGAAAQAAMDRASRLAREGWPALQAAVDALVAGTGLRRPVTVAEATAALDVASQARDFLRTYKADLFRLDLKAAAKTLERARGWLPRLWASVVDGEFKRTVRAFRDARRTGSAGTRQLLDEAHRALSLQASWSARADPGALPAAAPNLDGARRAMETALADAGPLADVLAPSRLQATPGDGASAGSERQTRPAIGPVPVDARPDTGGGWSRLTLDDAGQLFRALAADTFTPPKLPRLFEIERDLDVRGVSAFVDELRAQKPPPDRWPLQLRHAWWTSCLDAARMKDSALAGFNGRTHDAYVEEFQRLDRERLMVAVARVRRTHAERVIAVRNAHPEQDALVVREAAKKARHLPLRRLLAEAPDVLTALRPCWMASPLSVSQLLASDRQYFDVVIFDEASQVLPEDAVPALLRAPRAVVAGDQRQLPPTTFFAAADVDEDLVEEAGAAEGFESILDVMSSFLDPPWSLEWHYRSRDEALIAFSNHHIYGDRLVTFPGPGGEAAVSHVLVPWTHGADGQEESASAEVNQVVELVLSHARERPQETLGVIAMGIPHARRVEAAIDRARAARPELDAFFDQSRSDRFFVKNLERVQGDERDAILLTIGYGKDRSGRLPYRFGPLLTDGGERRLNVAVTRARRRLTLVSSFSHADMDPSRSTALGVELLRAYLEYAASGGRRFGGERPTGALLNAFEQSVHDHLTARGLSLLPQWGASRYRIDLVAQHPFRPGRLVLAIECDGASYHSSPTARDRDRLRQQHLEALGWRFHRIWSTDWFLRKDEETDRVLRAFEEAVRNADRVDAGATSASPANGRPLDEERGWSTEVGQLRRPRLEPGRSIDDYGDEELVRLVRWLLSRRLMTDEEIVDEAVAALGFQRRGRRIEEALRRAILVARGQG